MDSLRSLAAVFALLLLTCPASFANSVDFFDEDAGVAFPDRFAEAGDLGGEPGFESIDVAEASVPAVPADGSDAAAEQKAKADKQQAKAGKKDDGKKPFKFRGAASERREGPAGGYTLSHLEPGGICDQAKEKALVQAREHCGEQSKTVNEETFKWGECWLGQLPSRNRVSIRLLGHCK